MSKAYLIRLPWPPSKSSPNGPQGDWRGKAKAGADYKAQCAWECKAQGVRPVDYAPHVEINFHPPSNRAYDLDNALAKAKRGLDAVADAIGVDDAKWASMALLRGPKVKGGCVLVKVEAAE